MAEKPIRQHATPKLEAKFHALVDRSNLLGCWPWKGDTNGARGYGRFRFRNMRWRAHRVAFVLATGREVPPGLLVTHRCDNRRCCNPRHLEAETLAINTLHAMAAGRHTHGERTGSSKLTEADARQAHAMIQAGVPLAEIASAFNVRAATISDIKNGRTWRHVTGLPRVRRRTQRITIATAHEIVTALAAGMTKREAAARFGMGTDIIRDVARGDVLLALTDEATA